MTSKSIRSSEPMAPVGVSQRNKKKKKMGIKIQVQNQESYPLSLLLESDVYTLGIGYAGLAWEIARFARNVPCFYGNGAATSKATLRRTDSV